MFHQGLEGHQLINHSEEDFLCISLCIYVNYFLTKLNQSVVDSSGTQVTSPGPPLISAPSGASSSGWAPHPLLHTVHLFIFCPDTLSPVLQSGDTSGALLYSSQEVPGGSSSWFPHYVMILLFPLPWLTPPASSLLLPGISSQRNYLHHTPVSGSASKETHTKTYPFSLIVCFWYLFISAPVFYLILWERLMLYFIICIYCNLTSHLLIDI